jgi:hypothetical protein
MSTDTAQKPKAKRVPVLKDDIAFNHIWELNYKLTNARGINGFAGLMIQNYIDPATGAMRKYVDENNTVYSGYWLGEVKKILDPSRYPAHKRVLEFLLGSPEVAVVRNHANMDNAYFAKKQSNPRLTLLNKTYEDLSELEDENYIDLLKGRISMEGGPKALGVDKLRWILAQLNHTYRYPKYDTASNEKNKLRKELKKFVGQRKANAQDVYAILDNLENAKMTFICKEFVEYGIIAIVDGMFVYNNNPISGSFESLKEYMKANPDYFGKLQKRLLDIYEEKGIN